MFNATRSRGFFASLMSKHDGVQMSHVSMARCHLDSANQAHEISKESEHTHETLIDVFLKLSMVDDRSI